MSKIKSFYSNDVDKVWYDSSNVLYSECDDITDGLKVLRVTFKNGRTYQYYDVNVNDYLLFRENASQGVALNKFIKQYKCERIDDLNVDDIQSELEKLNTAESLKTKKELFEMLGNVCETIVSAREGLKGYDLTDNELAFLLHIINKINQSLLITNFSNKEINLLEINSILENHSEIIKEEGCCNFTEKLKDKLLQ